MPEIVREYQAQKFAEITVNEKNVVLLSGTLLDQAGDPVLLSALSTLTLTLYNRDTDAIINSRTADNILNTGGGTFHPTTGAFTLTLSTSDNPIVVTTLGVGVTEVHYALIQATWSGGGYWSGLAQVNVRQVHRVP